MGCKCGEVPKYRVCGRDCYTAIEPLRNRRARRASLIACRSCSRPAVPTKTCCLLRIASSAEATNFGSFPRSVSKSAASYCVCRPGKRRGYREGSEFAIGRPPVIAVLHKRPLPEGAERCVGNTPTVYCFPDIATPSITVRSASTTQTRRCAPSRFALKSAKP